MAQNKLFFSPNAINNTRQNAIYDEAHRYRMSSQQQASKQTRQCATLPTFFYGLLIGALATAIVLAVILTLWLSSNQSVSTSTATGVVTTATSTVPLPLKCFSYMVINDTTRLTTASGLRLCGRSVFSSNYTTIRFSGAGGTQLATTPPSTSQCGTDAPGWYNGSLPVVGATANGTVCYHWSSNTCMWSNTILVTNCTTFYVYDLTRPPACSLRYCTV